MEKFPLIDLEARQRVTGRKQAQAVQRERLSGETPRNGMMRQSGLRYNCETEAAEGMPKSFPAIRKNGHKSNRMWRDIYGNAGV